MPKFYNSFYTKSPATLKGTSIPTIEEWALCIVPKASLTKISEISVNFYLNIFISFLSTFCLVPSGYFTLPSSSGLNLKFSNKKIPSEFYSFLTVFWFNG